MGASKKALEMGTSFHGGLVGKPGRGLICRELYMWKALGRVPLPTVAPLGIWGGVRSTGNFESYMKEGSGASLYGTLLGEPGGVGPLLGNL